MELDVTVTEDGMSWDLWQRQHGKHMPLGFWSQLFKGARKEVFAVLHALLATEHLTKEQLVVIRTGNPIKGREPTFG